MVLQVQLVLLLYTVVVPVLVLEHIR